MLQQSNNSHGADYLPVDAQRPRKRRSQHGLQISTSSHVDLRADPSPASPWQSLPPRSSSLQSVDHTSTAQSPPRKKWTRAYPATATGTRPPASDWAPRAHTPASTLSQTTSNQDTTEFPRYDDFHSRSTSPTSVPDLSEPTSPRSDLRYQPAIPLHQMSNPQLRSKYQVEPPHSAPHDQVKAPGTLPPSYMQPRDRNFSHSSAKRANNHAIAPALRPSTSASSHAFHAPTQPRSPFYPATPASARSSVYSVQQGGPYQGSEANPADEVRSTFRSALTTRSSPKGDSSGTERSSLVSKSSTTSGSTNGVMTVDEAIGMYERGFVDDPATAKIVEQDETDVPSEQTVSSGKAEVHAGHFEAEALPPPPPPQPPSLLLATSEPSINREPGLPNEAFLKPTENQGRAAVASSFASQKRDRYGFWKATQHTTLGEYDAWDGSYKEHLSRRKQKWVALMKGAGLSTENPAQFPARSSKIKRYVRKGIPPEWRGAAWFWYAGGHIQLQRHPQLYEQLVAKAENGKMTEYDREMIEKDLHRSFPDNVRYKPDVVEDPSTATANGTANGAGVEVKETTLLHSLRRVLQAFSIYAPHIGYCQSLNFIAGQLLLFLPESHAFWLLAIITTAYLPGTHSLNLEGANTDLGVLMTCLRDALPSIYNALLAPAAVGSPPAINSNPALAASTIPSTTLSTTAWFMSCFIGTLPVETCLRVWDTLFYEGSKTLFRISLALFKLAERDIRAVRDPAEIFQVIQSAPRRLIDANLLMDACYRRRNGFGHLTQAQVEQRRRAWRKGIIISNLNGAAAAVTETTSDSETAKDRNSTGRPRRIRTGSLSRAKIRLKRAAT
ncbi:MAG: hypothetical protein M1825_004076 [Sarcosagium campestre]|nr:MAG: hypothetical protein M1825_004076 [Sarcosagium campestre]